MTRFLYALHPPLIMSVLTLSLTRVSVVFVIGVIIFFTDTYGRMKDYIHLRNKPHSYFTMKVIQLYGRSWCGRTVVKAVFPPARTYYRDMGYRWWHMLPDGSISMNSPFLKKNFWISLSKGYE